MTSRQSVEMLLIGHITADIIPGGRTLGGTPSYAAATAHAMGIKLGAVTSARPDDTLLDEFRQYANAINLPAEHTTTFENIYEPQGRKQYVRGTASPISVADIPAEWKSTPLVLISPMVGEIDPQLVYEFPDSITLITLQGWLRQWDDAGLVSLKRWFDADILRTIDFAIFSEEDIRAAPQLEQEMAQVARNLIVTRADKGGTYYFPGGRYNYDAINVEVVHSTGAGDVFAAALLVALHKLGGDVKTALNVASALAGYSVTREGLASAPTAEEVHSVMQRYEVS